MNHGTFLPARFYGSNNENLNPNGKYECLLRRRKDSLQIQGEIQPISWPHSPARNCKRLLLADASAIRQVACLSFVSINISLMMTIICLSAARWRRLLRVHERRCCGGQREARCSSGDKKAWGRECPCWGSFGRACACVREGGRVRTLVFFF